MIVDTSVIVAIYKKEASSDRLDVVIQGAERLSMSAASFLEASIVIDANTGVQRTILLEDYLANAGIEIVPFTPEQAQLARRAYQRYGKGSGHPARLNFGDCFAYALSVQSGEPLLFVGEDFTHTDVLPVLPL